ncbi:hypothetical protein EDB84DRAFT_1509711, partial [Lactarius hengduanensis]
HGYCFHTVAFIVPVIPIFVAVEIASSSSVHRHLDCHCCWNWHVRGRVIVIFMVTLGSHWPSAAVVVAVTWRSIL